MKKMVCLLLVLLAGVSSAHADDGGKAFLEKFYQEGVEVDFSESFLKMHLTKNAMQYLKDSYSYDGEGIASWLFYMEGGSDIGEMREVLVTKVKENTYKVIVRSNFNEDTYEYLMQRRAEAQILKASNTPDNEILDIAILRTAPDGISAASTISQRLNSAISPPSMLWQRARS